MSTPPTLADLRTAAIEATKPPETAPVVAPPSGATAPAEPAEPYTITENADGTVHVKLETGEEFKGSWKEVGPKLAKSKHDSSAYAKELKAKLDAGAPPAAAQQAAATTQLKDDLSKATTQAEVEAANAKYFALMSSDPKAFAVQALADEFGLEPEEMKEFFKGIYNGKQLQNTEKTISAFRQNASDFPATPDNLIKLGEYMDAQSLPFNAANMRAAWVLMKEDPNAAIKPLTPEQVKELLATEYAKQTGVKVPPIPQSTPSPVSVLTDNPWTMPMGKLREQALKAGKA
jgi:hypothetical protein